MFTEEELRTLAREIGRTSPPPKPTDILKSSAPPVTDPVGVLMASGQLTQNVVPPPIPPTLEESPIDISSSDGTVRVASSGRSYDLSVTAPVTPAARSEVTVYTDSLDVKYGGVVGLGEPRNTVPSATEIGLMVLRTYPQFKGETPAEEHALKFGVLLSDLTKDFPANAAVSGICAAKVDVENEDHTYAYCKEGETAHLVSCPIGPARILWRESGTGEKWAQVSIDNAYPNVPTTNTVYIWGFDNTSQVATWISTTQCST